MTLDGVIQAPGQPGEDKSGGFQYGRWHVGYFDDIAQGRVVESVVNAGGYLLGRRTYEIFAAHWPNASQEEQVLAEPLAWQNSMVLQDDVAEAVVALKQEDGGDLHVIGSSELVQTLFEHGLVDEFRLMLDPVVVGGGKRLFREDGVCRELTCG
jgi:dihydrofolate reductase